MTWRVGPPGLRDVSRWAPLPLSVPGGLRLGALWPRNCPSAPQHLTFVHLPCSSCCPHLTCCARLCLNQPAQLEGGIPQLLLTGPFLLWAAVFLRLGAGIPWGSRAWGKSRLLVGVSLAVLPA